MLDDKLKVQCKGNTHLFHVKYILDFSSPGTVDGCPLPDFFLGNCAHRWQTTAHLDCELNYDLNTFPLHNVWNLLPSCASDSFLTLRKGLPLGLFFLCKSKIRDTFLIQTYENIPLPAKWDGFIMFLSPINLVARCSLNHSQYHHANPFTVVRLYS